MSDWEYRFLFAVIFVLLAVWMVINFWPRKKRFSVSIVDAEKSVTDRLTNIKADEIPPFLIKNKISSVRMEFGTQWKSVYNIEDFIWDEDLAVLLGQGSSVDLEYQDKPVMIHKVIIARQPSRGY